MQIGRTYFKSWYEIQVRRPHVTEYVVTSVLRALCFTPWVLQRPRFLTPLGRIETRVCATAHDIDWTSKLPAAGFCSWSSRLQRILKHVTSSQHGGFRQVKYEARPINTTQEM